MKKRDARNCYPATNAMGGRSKSTILKITNDVHAQQVKIVAKALTVLTTTVIATNE